MVAAPAGAERLRYCREAAGHTFFDGDDLAEEAAMPFSAQATPACRSGSSRESWKSESRWGEMGWEYVVTESAIKASSA